MFLRNRDTDDSNLCWFQAVRPSRFASKRITTLGGSAIVEELEMIADTGEGVCCPCSLLGSDHLQCVLLVLLVEALMTVLLLSFLQPPILWRVCCWVVRMHPDALFICMLQSLCHACCQEKTSAFILSCVSLISSSASRERYSAHAYWQVSLVFCCCVGTHVLICSHAYYV